MKKPSIPAERRIVSSPLRRDRAERISAVEGLRLNAPMAQLLNQCEQQGLSGAEKRERIRAAFDKKHR